MELSQLKNVLESLLYVAREPLAVEELERIIAVPRELITAALAELTNEYQNHGLQVIKVAGGYLMGTKPENAAYVEKVLHPREETRLTPQALETLAIIAYKQPVTRAEIERLRGVISDGVIETLLIKKMVRELGRSETVGHPYLYGTTEDFMRHFGIHDLKELPPLPPTESEQEHLFKSALHETSA